MISISGSDLAVIDFTIPAVDLAQSATFPVDLRNILGRAPYRPVALFLTQSGGTIPFATASGFRLLANGSLSPGLLLLSSQIGFDGDLNSTAVLGFDPALSQIGRVGAYDLNLRASANQVVLPDGIIFCKFITSYGI